MHARDMTGWCWGRHQVRPVFVSLSQGNPIHFWHYEAGMPSVNYVMAVIVKRKYNSCKYCNLCEYEAISMVSFYCQHCYLFMVPQFTEVWDSLLSSQVQSSATLGLSWDWVVDDIICGLLHLLYSDTKLFSFDPIGGRTVLYYLYYKNIKEKSTFSGPFR